MAFDATPSEQNQTHRKNSFNGSESFFHGQDGTTTRNEKGKTGGEKFSLPQLGEARTPAFFDHECGKICAATVNECSFSA
jgi:hypothetical protein